MLFEIHAHTTKYSRCSNMSPEEYLRTAREKGLGGICFTEHNMFWPEEQFTELKNKAGDLVLINGIEQRCWDNNILQGDFLVFGCKFENRRPNVFDLIDLVHEKGGIIIAAHPFRGDLGVTEELVHQLNLDGLEVYSSNQETWQIQLAIETASTMNIPTLSGSDTHDIETVGYSTINFTVPVNNEVDFVNAIKNMNFDINPHE